MHNQLSAALKERLKDDLDIKYIAVICLNVVCVHVCGKELMDKRMYFYAIVLTCMHVACVGGRVIKSGRSSREGISTVNCEL